MTFIITPVIAGIISLCIGSFVLIKNPKKKPNRIFFFLSLSLAIWNLTSLGIYLAPNAEVAVTWIKLLYIGLVFIPSLFLHFVLTAIDDHSILNKRLYTIGYILSYLFLLLAGTGVLSLDVIYIGDYYYSILTNTGVSFICFTGIYGGYGCCLLLYRRVKAINIIEKHQITFFLLSGLILFAGIIANMLCSLGIWVYPWGHLGTIIYSLITAYAIIKYQLITIEVDSLASYKNRCLYLIINAIPCIVLFSCIIGIERLFHRGSEEHSIFLYVTVIMVSAVILNFLRPKFHIWFVNYFFRRQYHQKDVIKDICRDIISTFDKEKLMSILLNAVTNLLYTDRVAVALLDETTHKEYYIHHGIGIDLVKKRTLRFKKNEGLAYHLGNKKEILIKNELVRNKMSNVHWRELIRDFEKIDAQVCAPLLVKDKLIGMVLLHEKVSGERYQEEDIQILYILTNYASIALENIYTYYKQLKGFVNVIQRLIIMLEAKDKYFHGHCKRVSAYSTAIAQELGLNNNIVNMTGIAGILHDIGNISVSEQVLQKPGRLNKGEFENIKQHAMIGTMIVEPMGLEKEIVDSIKYHHERLDGSGYPVGLTDKEIPLIAKIIAVADVFDAMTSKRPYRKAFSREDAIIELKRRCGYEFDESVVDAFITILTKDTARRYVRKR